MSTKKISVNPAFFKINGSKTLKKRERRERKIREDLQNKQNNKVKKGLLEKIKAHKKLKQEEKKRQLSMQNSNSEGENESELDKSLNYLHDLSKKHKSKKQKKRELKLARKMEREPLIQQNMQPITSSQYAPASIQPYLQHQSPLNQDIHINTPLLNNRISQVPAQQPSLAPLQAPSLAPLQQPSAYIVENSITPKPDPPYGILKHGKKPLFSLYNKTLKKPTEPTQQTSEETRNPLTINNNIKIHTDEFFERREKLDNLKDSCKIGGSLATSIKPKRNKTLKKMKQISTTTKRFIHLGKKDGKVGVLIKNQKTRKKILKDTITLKKRPLRKIKDYLRKHNLIKIGSSAPEHIIRNIYENSFLAGDIYNKNIDTLLHNYLDK
jgi:hypothetical protein